jgi:hypothetical protein
LARSRIREAAPEVFGHAAAPRPRVELCCAGDEERLAAFDQRSGGTPSTAAFWRWKYYDNPAGAACVAVASVGQEVVGRAAWLPVRTRVHGREVVAAQQVDVALMKEHRGGGVYFQLVDALMGEVEERGIAFGFGFSNDDTRALSVDLLGFDLVAPIHRLSRVLDYGHHAGAFLGRRAARFASRVAAAMGVSRVRVSPRLDGNIVPIDRFDGRFDDLAATLIREPIATVRDAAFLNWRYVACPTVEYRRYAARRGDAVCGFVVLHTREVDGAVRGVFDELVCSPDDPDTVEGLVSTALSDLAAAGAVSATCWLPDWHPLGARLRALGFRDRPSRNHLIVIANGNAEMNLEELTRDRDWYYTHGNSDVGPAVGTARSGAA